MILIESNAGSLLATVLSHYGLLEQGNEFKIICPFHGDVNASMKVNLNDGSFFCFGCGASGDAMKFVSLANKNLDDLHACLEYYKVLKKQGGKLIKVKPVARVAADQTQKLIEAYDYYHGLSKEKWSHSQKSDQAIYMKKRGFEAITLEKCGAKLTYNAHYPIIFPMRDLGEFKGWVCRTMSKEVEAKRKYLYNEGFSRRDTLVGDYSSKTVVLVEGYMDYLKMKQFGVKKVAAILGWKVTEQQISKLKKQGVTTIISALDNDQCGNKGTEYLKKFFTVIRFCFPEGVKDPGDLNKATFTESNDKTKKIFRRTIHNGTS